MRIQRSLIAWGALDTYRSRPYVPRRVRKDHLIRLLETMRTYGVVRYVTPELTLELSGAIPLVVPTTETTTNADPTIGDILLDEDTATVQMGDLYRAAAGMKGE